MRSLRSLLMLVAVALLSSVVTLAAQQPDTTQRRAFRRDTVRLTEIKVIGSTTALDRIPGSGQVVDSATLASSRAFTVNEALRKVPGIVARDEEGFGLRPNIGIRGLNPTRSSKVLLLEDGLPFTIAPYGANESYYHPPVDRFERIEVLKGSGQILFGPQTIGGVINYVTPSIPVRTTGFVSLTPGNRDYLNAHGRFGGTWGRVGLLLDYVRKQGDGARDNVGSQLNDANVKASFALSPTERLTVRGNYYAEDSRITYSGLTEAEYAAAPYSNPFVNDSMLLDRWGGSLAHRIELGGSSLTTTVYGYSISRDWWRQSSFSSQRPNDASDPACGGIGNLSTSCGNEGRLRDYQVWGFEPRLALTHGLFGLSARTDVGARFHAEVQDRLKVNGATPNAREPGPSSDPNSGIREINNRQNRAVSAWVQSRLVLGQLTVSPGLRVEHIEYERSNYLASAAFPQGTRGTSTLTELIPGLGATIQAGTRATLFAGVHRGFAPPRTEDVIDNATGGVVDLEAEQSWNLEAGARLRPAEGLSLEATLFRMDFENQIIAASLAGGTGAGLTSAGRTLHQGAELSGRLDGAALFRTTHNVWLEAAWTWLPTAEFSGDRFVYVGTRGSDLVGKVYAGQDGGNTRAQVRVTGNRLPYAPEHLLSATIGYAHAAGLEMQIEGVYLGRQYGDALNTEVLAADGQQGPIAAVTLFNAAASYRLPRVHSTVFVTVKNLIDRRYIADRSRGIIPGAPRLLQAGISQTF